MYYLADKDRQSAFFLYEDKKDEIHNTIADLTERHLNKSKNEILDQLKRIEKEYI